jgi:hypothetical protein
MASHVLLPFVQFLAKARDGAGIPSIRGVHAPSVRADIFPVSAVRPGKSVLLGGLPGGDAPGITAGDPKAASSEPRRPR